MDETYYWKKSHVNILALTLRCTWILLTEAVKAQKQFPSAN